MTHFGIKIKHCELVQDACEEIIMLLGLSYYGHTRSRHAHLPTKETFYQYHVTTELEKYVLQSKWVGLFTIFFRITFQKTQSA